MSCPLQEEILSRVTKYTNTDSRLKQMIYDHHVLLIENSDIVYITPYEQTRYIGFLDGFLFSRKINPSISWIVCYINNIDPKEFENITQLYIPKREYLDKLISNFESYVALTDAN
ncbi:MAG: hypothetical protein GY804_09110 [Alphaproteobacteria bacterium]|nr:hypothetical protein [Alphaproteobacteria bacterium]